MDVIQFPYRPLCRAYFYVEEGNNVIQKWLDDEGITLADRAALKSLIDIYEAGGIGVISTTVLELGDGLFGMLVKRKGGVHPCPIFCLGPVDTDSEITFLAGAVRPKKQLRPYHAIGFAKERYEILQRDSTRRRYEPIT